MKLLVFACLLAMSAASISGNSSTYAQHVNKTTAFMNVIKTDDVDERDPIYMTPAVVMIGKRNGNILRCLQEDLNECEVFYKSGQTVRSLVVTGEYLYAGLDGGAILRCELNIKSCNTLHTCETNVHALAVAGGYLYAGLYSGAILRCELNLRDSCQKLNTPYYGKVYSLVQFKEYIYAGHENGELVRYSIRAEDSNTLVYNMTSTITGLINYKITIYAITWVGDLWRCPQKSNPMNNSCELVKTTYENPSAIAQFSDMLYVLNEKGLHVCEKEKSDTCLTYEHHKDSWSMAVAYGTYQMQSRYKNEHTACTWQNNSKCPPFVTYYNVQDRDMLEVNVKDGKLYNAQGLLVDTSKADIGHYGRAAIFAMGPDGKILLSNSHKRELLHTSSLFAGSPVSGAGVMVVKDGVIVKMKACSEHYRLDADMNKQVIQSLLAQGYSHPVTSESYDL